MPHLLWPFFNNNWPLLNDVFFKKQQVEETWRNAVIYMLHTNYACITPGPPPDLGHTRNEDRRYRYLHAQYHRAWKPHVAKKTRGAWRSVKYLGRSLKRSPVAASQLRHYRGTVVHKYYDHCT
uniref:transposase n=1 Tax=Serratia quinivorans TaxID=137545 RepID=UPI001CB8AEEE|nr:transposase [Serratia quinivorans]